VSNTGYTLAISTLVFLSVFLLFGFGWPTLVAWFHAQRARYERVLVQQLMLDVSPTVATWASLIAIVILILVGYRAADSVVTAAMGAALGFFLPQMVVRHLEQKRSERLESQLVDGITTLSSGVRAGLTLVQSMELLVSNSVGPIKQEFSQGFA